ncbi:MAG: polysaccharide pyruvyl transferase CsaB [Peptostreptococcaceae bacterium]
MKLVISGYYGFDNLGDEAILQSIIMALKEADENIEITVLSNNPIKTQQNYKVNAINRWSIKKIYKEIKLSDGLISGGGSLLQDVTSSRSIFYYIFIIGIANLVDKPIFIYAQGIGPINKRLNKKIVKFFLNKAQYITLRDEESSKLIKSIGVNTKIDIVPDPVMGLDISNSDLKCKKNNYIIISIRDWGVKKSYLNQIAMSCNAIIKEGIDIKLLPMHGKLDEGVSKQLAEMIEYEVEVLSYEMKMDEKLKYVSKAKLMIGMRLHALIFAGNVGTPMIGISYDPKIDSYLKLVDQPCIGNINDGIDSYELTQKSLQIVSNYDSIREKLEQNTSKLKSTAKLTAIKAINTFKTYR